MPFFSQKSGKRSPWPWFGSGIASVLVALLGISLFLFPVGNWFRERSYDLPFLLRAQKLPADVVIVSLNDVSYKAMNQDRHTFDRALHARLVKRLMEHGAKGLVFDIVFQDPAVGNTNGTSELAAAILKWTNVVLAAQYLVHKSWGAAQGDFVGPVDTLRVIPEGLGLANVHRDSDFSVRRHHPGIRYVPSLGWRAAELTGEQITKHPERRFDQRWLNYYSPQPFQEIPYQDVLTTNTWGSGTSFSNKMVFVGETHVAGYVGEEKEEYRYPWTGVSGGFVHGVEIHALTYSNLVRQDWLLRLPAFVEVIIIGFFGTALGYGLSLLRPLRATVGALIVSLFVAGCAYFTFAYLNIWFPWLIIVAAQIPLALGCAYVSDSVRSYIERELLKNSLELYLSPHQVKEILKQPDLLKPGAEQKTISILFSDIANFSKASEMLHPIDLVKLLNDYYEVAIGAVHETGGTVMNLIGDAIFAIWNAPQEQKEHQKLACQAAILLNQRVVQFNAGHESVHLRTRIGLHTGIACVGNIGSQAHFDYAAIGESVNMASRLEGLNKKLRTNILATREIQTNLDGGLVSRFVGHFRFKGLVQIDQVHEILGPAEMEGETREWRKAFSDGLGCWKARQFRKAEEQFRRALELRPKPAHAADDDPTDGPSDFYLKLIPEFIKNPPPPEWLGEIDLRDK